MSIEIRFKNENLLQYRKEKGLSQEELANLIGVSRQAIYKWETEGRMPDMNNIISLCKEFDKPIEDFIDGADEYFKVEKGKTNRKKISKVKILKTLIIILIDLYLLVAVLKLSVVGILYVRINKYKDSNEYSFWRETNLYRVSESIDDEYNEYSYYIRENILFKNNVQRKNTYSQRIEDGKLMEEDLSDFWLYIEGDLREDYKITYGGFDEKGFAQNNYYYSKSKSIYNLGFESNPYESTLSSIKNVCDISFILNPLKLIELDLQNGDLILKENLIFENKYNGQMTKYYFELSTGLLSKEEIYRSGKLELSFIYYDCKFDDIKDYDVFLSDVQKYEIIEGSFAEE